MFPELNYRTAVTARLLPPASPTRFHSKKNVPDVSRPFAFGKNAFRRKLYPFPVRTTASRLTTCPIRNWKNLFPLTHCPLPDEKTAIRSTHCPTQSWKNAFRLTTCPDRILHKALTSPCLSMTSVSVPGLPCSSLPLAT